MNARDVIAKHVADAYREGHRVGADLLCTADLRDVATGADDLLAELADEGFVIVAPDQRDAMAAEAARAWWAATLKDHGAPRVVAPPGWLQEMLKRRGRAAIDAALAVAADAR